MGCHGWPRGFHSAHTHDFPWKYHWVQHFPSSTFKAVEHHQLSSDCMLPCVCVRVPISPAPVFVLLPDLAFFLLFHMPSALGDPAVSRGWTGPSPELPASPALLSSCGPVTCSTFRHSSSSSSPAGTSPTPAGTPFLCGYCRLRYGVQSSTRSKHRLILQQSVECMTQVPAGHLLRVPSKVPVCSLVERRGLAPVSVRAVPPTPLVCAAWTRDGRSTLMSTQWNSEQHSHAAGDECQAANGKGNFRWFPVSHLCWVKFTYFSAWANQVHGSGELCRHTSQNGMCLPSAFAKKLSWKKQTHKQTPHTFLILRSVLSPELGLFPGRCVRQQISVPGWVCLGFSVALSLWKHADLPMEILAS